MDVGFHRRSGSMVTVSNNGRTAQRNHPEQEFNNGVVVSAEPIRDNHLFEVKIDRKVLFVSISGVEICQTNLNISSGFFAGAFLNSCKRRTGRAYHDIAGTFLVHFYH